MHPIRRKEAIFDPLLQTILIDRVAKVGVGVAIVVAQGRGRHPHLHRRGEVFQNLVPTAFFVGASPMALIHDDQVEEVGRVVAIQTGPPLRIVHRLIDSKVHLAACIHFALKLFSRVTEDGELFAVRVVHQNVAIGEEQHLGFAPGSPGTIPFFVPQLPANLRGNRRLARAGSQREQDALAAQQDRLHGAVDGNLLIVAQRLARIGRGQQPRRDLGSETFFVCQPPPQFVRAGKRAEFARFAGQIVVLDDAQSIGGISKPQIQNFGVFFGLL